MENQTTSTSEQAGQQPTLNQSPLQQPNAQPNALGYPSPQMLAAYPERTTQTEFLQNLVLKLMPNGQIASMQSNPSQVQPAPSTTQPQTQATTTPTPQPDEPTYWAGNEELTNFLEEHGVKSVHDILEYTAGQEQSTQQYQEIFEYAMHPDPEIRAAFWENYQSALTEQTGEQPQQSQSQRQSFPGTPQGYGQYNTAPDQFTSLEQLDDMHRMMQSGLPGITPQELARFDRMLLNTPGQFWGQQIFNAGDI